MITINQNSFQLRLDEALKIRDITPAELSRLSNVDEGAISSYRAGKYKASQKNLDKIAEALNVSIAWLMGYDVPMGGYEKSQPPVIIKDSHIIQDSIAKADEIKNHSVDFQITLQEQQLIKKYRSLDKSGKETVSTVLDLQYQRCVGGTEDAEFSNEIC